MVQRHIPTAYQALDGLGPRLISSKTLHAVRDFFMGYATGLSEINIKLEEGDPPFSQFGYWLARRYGKSTKGHFKQWPQTTMGWWRIIEEQFGSDEAGYNVLYELLAEYRRQRWVVKGHAAVPNAEKYDPPPLRFELVEIQPDGFMLYLVYSDSDKQVQGFYSTLDDLLSGATEQFCVPASSWEVDTKSPYDIDLTRTP